jgi:hypothetical protein
MSKLKRVGLSFLLGLVAAAAMAVPAQAEGPLKGVCVIAGSAKVSDKEAKNVAKPSLPGTTGTRKGVRLSGGHGSYEFTALEIICVGTEKGSPAIKALVVESRGWFDNIVCGTGVAFSHKWKDQKPWGPGQVHGTTLVSKVKPPGLPSTHGDAFYDSVVKSLEYKIEFVGGMGHIHLNNDPNEVIKTIPKINVLEQDKASGKPTQPLFLAGWIGLGLKLVDPGNEKPGQLPLDILNNKAAKDPTDLTKYNCVNSFSVLGVVLIDKSPK